MIDDGARARVRHAREELELAQRRLDTHWQSWREYINRHRVSLLIGTGLLGGVAAATVSTKRWSRLGATLFGCSAWLVRSPIGPSVLAALWTRIFACPAAGDIKRNSTNDAPFD